MMNCSTRGIAHVERVAAAGEVHVIARVFRREAVVAGVVDAAERDRRAQLVAFGRVVVDDVENHFDARVVQVADHRFEFAESLRPAA